MKLIVLWKSASKTRGGYGLPKFLVLLIKGDICDMQPVSIQQKQLTQLLLLPPLHAEVLPKEQWSIQVKPMYQNR